MRRVSIVTGHEWRLVSLMKSKLLIVADLGRVKAYKLDYTLNNTPRLEQLEEITLEEAHSRLLEYSRAVSKSLHKGHNRGTICKSDFHGANPDNRR